MSIQILDYCKVRWQAALAVVEDLEADPKAHIKMNLWKQALREKHWYEPECGTAGCFAGWASISPYCRELGLTSPPENEQLAGARRL